MFQRKNRTFGVLLGIALMAVSCAQNDYPIGSDLDEELRDVLYTASNGIGSQAYILPESNDYGSIPQDPRNRLTREKVQLGMLLFHETGLAVNPRDPNNAGTYSCASCHHAQGGFQACLPQGISEGGMGFGFTGEGRVPNPQANIDSLDVQPIRTPSAMNGAYQKVTLWNGQFGSFDMNAGTEGQWTAGTPKEVNHLGYEGLEIQAIAGLDVHRMDIDTAFITNTPLYKNLFNYAFPTLSREDRISRETAGLAIAAYERTMLANKAPFQEWLRGDNGAMTDDQKEGAILFFGKAGCGSCHNGPALNSMEFYALGMNDLVGAGIYGSSPFDAAHLGRGGFTGNPADNFKFKVPQLYNLKDSPFYGHGGNFTTIYDVVKYKNEAVPQNRNVPPSQLASGFQPLNLAPGEVAKIVEFIERGLYDPNLKRYVPGSVPSGNCFPNNDDMSRVDLGCN